MSLGVFVKTWTRNYMSGCVYLFSWNSKDVFFFKLVTTLFYLHVFCQSQTMISKRRFYDSPKIIMDSQTIFLKRSI